MRELEPGEFAVSPYISGVQQNSYFFSEELGLGEQSQAPLPDEYVDGMMHRAWIGFDDETLYDHVYSKDDPVGTTDTASIHVPNTSVWTTEKKTLVADGKSYALWQRTANGHFTVELSIHTEAGWSDPVAFGDHTHLSQPGDFVVNSQGDVMVGWVPGGCNGPCLDDPGMVARFDAAADCWSSAMLETGMWDARMSAFWFTPSFVLTTVGPEVPLGSVVSQ